MRFVIGFLVIAGLWLVIGDYWNGQRVVDGFTSLFGGQRIADDAPNWGDVAAKIGELSEERQVLKDGLVPTGSLQNSAGNADLPAPATEPR